MEESRSPALHPFRLQAYLQLGSRSQVVSATTHGAITIATYASPARKSCIAVASGSIQWGGTQLSPSLSAKPGLCNRRPLLSANLGHASAVRCRFTHSTRCSADAKRPPGNRAAFSLGRIVPTEAKPSELSGCILSLAKTGVKAKTLPLQHVDNKYVSLAGVYEILRLLFALHILLYQRSIVDSGI
jgi:hypothetical protein